MFRKVWNKIRDANFSAKLAAVFVLSLIFGIGMSTYEQIKTSLAMVEREREESLSMITEQVALNFSDSQSALSSAIYSRLRALEIPTLMYEQIGRSDKGTAALQYALAQTISETTEYDFVAIDTSEEQRIYTRKNAAMDYSTYRELCTCAASLLDTADLSRYSGSRWVRAENGDVYIITNVYSTSPLKWVGRAIFHLKDGVFSVSEAYDNTCFAFFDSGGNYLGLAGMSADAEQREAITARFCTEGEDTSDSAWEEEYFVSRCTCGGWTAVGLSSKAVYYRMCRSIIRVGLTYGCFGLVVGIALVFLMVRSLSAKLRRIKYSMDQVSEGNLDSTIEITDNDNISQISMTFNRMMRRMKELLAEVAEKEKQKKNAELRILEYKYRSLETQIRPHFIYNAFEIVNAMAKIKGETEMVEIIQRISRYFRNITATTTRQFITTQQEFDALQDYTEIYRFIHGDRLKVTFSAREAARNAMIPTMIVQPIVENALKHGIRSQSEDSCIIVHAYIDGDQLNLTVKDTGCGLTPEQEHKFERGEQLSDPKHSGIGLGNVRDRLQLIYGGRASFTIHNRPEGGAVVKITIPLTYSEPILPFASDGWDFDA